MNAESHLLDLRNRCRELPSAAGVYRMQDARGDNMEMRGFGAGSSPSRGPMRPPSEDRD